MTPKDLAKELASNKQSLVEGLATFSALPELKKLKNKLIGKSSRLAELRSQLGELTEADRPEAGGILNQAQEEAESLYQARYDELAIAQEDERRQQEAQDLTEIIGKVQVGHFHPVTQMQWRLEDVFSSMGFKVVEGPEVETEENNFQALNFPEGHPARDMYDTFYVDHGEPNSTLLRTHTSPVQVRVMKSQEPPIYVVAPGRCYRQDTADATHMPVFHQIEGLVVDKGVTFGDLAGTIEEFIKALLGDEFRTRLRPSYFPFTEPSAEFDILVPETFTKNAGKWLEMGGCGMVHPVVLENCGISPEEYTGFAFGFGIDRLTMMELGIDDLREFWNGDVRFLNQF